MTPRHDYRIELKPGGYIHYKTLGQITNQPIEVRGIKCHQRHFIHRYVNYVNPVCCVATVCHKVHACTGGILVTFMEPYLI